MTSPIDRIIAALQQEHYLLAGFAASLRDDQLAQRSGATEWTIADALSHLGSGAEITLAGLRNALDGRPAPDAEFNPPVWDRWNALSAADKRAGALEQSAALVATFDALDQQQRDSLEIGVFYMPTPLPVATFAGLRLNEVVLHGWDIRAGIDPSAEVLDSSAAVLGELYAEHIGFLLGYVAKPERLDAPVVLELAGSGLAISIDDTVTVAPPADPATATFRGPLGAAIRLVAGRLRPEHTPPGVEVTGNVTLAELREVFPGY